MTQLPVQQACPEARSCIWTQHNRRHFPFKGMTRADTLGDDPALYLPGMKPNDIRALETETVQTGARLERTPNHSEYRRQMDKVIGWDDGKDAALSFAECSGGTNAGRSFHGRPMSTENRKADRQ